MPQVTVKLVDNSLMHEFYFTKNANDLAIGMLVEGKYTDAGTFFFDQTGEEAAEEAFDLTNNPNRQYEREKYYGRKRSVSVGDVVEVDGDLYLCAPTGWTMLVI